MHTTAVTPEELRHLDLCSEMAKKYGGGFADRFRLRDHLAEKSDIEAFERSAKAAREAHKKLEEDLDVA